MLSVQNNPQVELQATILVALSAILYGFLGSLGTELLKQHFSISTMLFWRFFIATVWMLVWEAITKKEKLLEITNRSAFIKAFILGAICYGGGSSFYFLASQQIGTGLAMVIFFTYPIFVVALAWLFERHVVSKYTAAALIAIVVGLFLIKGNHLSALNKTGVIFALIAGLFYGLYLYGSKKIVRSVSSGKLTILVCFSCALIFLIISILEHDFVYPTSLENWFYISAVGIVATALPIQLLLLGLKHIHPNKVSILSVLEPLVTLLIGVTVLHETTSILQAVGAFIILLSTICIQFEK